MKTQKRYALYFIIGVLVTIFCIFYRYSASITDVANNTLAIDYIKNGMIIKKDFKVSYNNLNKLGIKFGTYQKRNNEGIINIKVYDSNSNKIYDSDVDISELEDNQIYYFDIDNQSNSKNKTYNIILTVKSLNDDATVAIYGSNTNDNSIGIIYKIKKNDISLLIYIPIYIGIIFTIEIFRKK